MQGVSKVLKQYGEQYLRRFGKRMTAQQKKVLRAVMACREERLGTIRYRCVGCGHDETVPRSCCNRHCPACQWQKQQAWLAKQRDRLLPCHYFLITFTLPAVMRELALRHPREMYPALLTAAAESLKIGASSERFVGARETGFFGVLHTWGRDLSFHPHAHFLVAGGGIGRDGAWHSSRVSVFVPEQVLESLFKKRLQAKLRKADLLKHVPGEVWRGRFVVDSRAIGSGEHALKYLAPYVTRGCVAQWRVTACDEVDSIDDARLTLQVKRSGTRQYRGQPLSVIDFMRRWLRHVCPSGFHRVRHYGFLNSRSGRPIEEVRLLIAVEQGTLHYLACTEQLVMPSPPPMICRKCGGPMVCLGYLPPASLPSAPLSSHVRAPP
jgi:hypothetical protein